MIDLPNATVAGNVFLYTQVDFFSIHNIFPITFEIHFRYFQIQIFFSNRYFFFSSFIRSKSQSYFDFSVDEMGLWVIYGISESNNNTAVAKLNSYSLEIEYVWNISLNNHRAGEMFIACGVLYAVDSVLERNTKIRYSCSNQMIRVGIIEVLTAIIAMERFALDLYKNKLLDVELPFTNPFRRTTSVGYNSRTKVTRSLGHFLFTPKLNNFDFENQHLDTF